MRHLSPSRGSFLVLALGALLALPARASDPPYFTGLGHVPGGGLLTDVTGVSGDGSVVCGNESLGCGVAVRWTLQGGAEAIGDLSTQFPCTSAKAISADGTTIVGQSNSGSGTQAFRWTEATGMQGLGDLPGGQFGSWAEAVNANGTVIVGSSFSGVSDPWGVAFRWTAETGMVSLGDLSGGLHQSRALAVSADGTRVAGLGTLGPLSGASIVPARWTWPSAPVFVGDLPGGTIGGEAHGISANGNVIVGVCDALAGSSTGFRWSDPAAGGIGMQALEVPPDGGPGCNVADVSADGNVIVGSYYSDASADPEALVWIAGGGAPRHLESLLTQLGLDITGWKLFAARAVSADGRTIVGIGWNPQGQSESWIAYLGNAWTELDGGVAGVAGVPELSMQGTLIEGHSLLLELSGGKPAGSAALVVGLSALNAPFKGGTLVPNPDTLFTGLPLNGSGGLALASAWPTGLPAGFSIWLQAWIADAAAVQGFSASNGVVGTAP